jgi:hypothetical protein
MKDCQSYSALRTGIAPADSKRVVRSVRRTLNKETSMTDKPKLSSETTFMIDFNLEWVAAAAMAPDVPPAAAAAMFGITEDELAAYSAYVQDQVDRTAAELLAEKDIADGIDRLPVPRGGTVMAVGDSITTYRCGYADLLQAMIAARRPDDNIQFVNEGQAGYTSTNGLESTYTQFLAKQPDLVFVMFGVNDCRLSLPVVDLMSAFGPSPDPSLYLEDGVHPGPTGHRLIAQCVIGELTPNHA